MWRLRSRKSILSWMNPPDYWFLVKQTTRVKLQSAKMLIELGSSLASLSASRSAGLRPSASDYSSLLLDCAGSGLIAAAYRVYEQAIADGVRFSDLSEATQQALELRVPPEAEAFDSHTHPSTQAPADRQLWADPLPPLWVGAGNAVHAFDCSLGPQRDRELALSWDAVASRTGPVIFRGVGGHWPALSGWTLDRLSASMERGMVRVAPTAAVTFCRESHPDVRSGAVTPPSRTVSMATSEFVDRLCVGRQGRKPLFYEAGERVYMQASA